MQRGGLGEEENDGGERRTRARVGLHVTVGTCSYVSVLEHHKYDMRVVTRMQLLSALRTLAACFGLVGTRDGWQGKGIELSGHRVARGEESVDWSAHLGVGYWAAAARRERDSRGGRETT